MEVTTAPLTTDRWPDLAALFEADPVCRRCWCMWFLVPGKEFFAGLKRGADPDNRTKFQRYAATADPPAGLLAYRGGEPVGWCALGPRSRYHRLDRSQLLREHPAGPGDWYLACLFVDKKHRGQQVARTLVAAAVGHAARHGGKVLEGLPLAGPGPHPKDSAYVGTEPLLASCGFQVVDRPSPQRVLMRHELG